MSMMYPVPQATENALFGDIDFDGLEDEDWGNLAGSADLAGRFNECCQPMGMSTSRWCTPVGGRTRPGKDNAYLYMLWQYRDCCVR